MATLPERFWLVQEVADKLASLRAKAVKAKVACPFPFIDLVRHAVGAFAHHGSCVFGLPGRLPAELVQ